jgi:hypothetical protein
MVPKQPPPSFFAPYPAINALKKLFMLTVVMLPFQLHPHLLQILLLPTIFDQLLSLH